MAAKKKSAVVEFHFDDAELARDFLAWFCDGSGEQDYWQTMEDQGRPMASFDYHKLNRGKFGPKVAAPTIEEDEVA